MNKSFKNGNIEAKPPKALGLLTEEGTVHTEESTKGGPKQVFLMESVEKNNLFSHSFSLFIQLPVRVN